MRKLNTKLNYGIYKLIHIFGDQQKTSKATGLKQSRISNLLNGKRGDITLKESQKILSLVYGRVTVADLLTRVSIDKLFECKNNFDKDEWHPI